MESREKIFAVQRMQDCIDRHLREPISLYMLAQAAGYSPWHSARLFKEMTGKTPFEYIRALRLSQAAVRLREGDVRVVDVAFDFVFESHEGFTRAFSKQFGISPRLYSREKPEVRLFMPLRASDYYLRQQKGEIDMTKNAYTNTNTVFVQVVDRPERKLILKRGIKAAHYFDYCNEVGCDIWDELSKIKDALYEPIGMWLPAGMVKPGTSTYAQGVEMPRDYQGPVPQGYEMITLPACKMMVFQGQPFDDAKFGDAISDLWDVMKKYDPKIYGFEWADDGGPRFQLSPMGYRGYIEARPVRQINIKQA
jgi:AraC family transcriptional regulator